MPSPAKQIAAHSCCWPVGVANVGLTLCCALCFAASHHKETRLLPGRCQTAPWPAPAADTTGGGGAAGEGEPPPPQQHRNIHGF